MFEDAELGERALDLLDRLQRLVGRSRGRRDRARAERQCRCALFRLQHPLRRRVALGLGAERQIRRRRRRALDIVRRVEPGDLGGAPVRQPLHVLALGVGVLQQLRRHGLRVAGVDQLDRRDGGHRAVEVRIDQAIELVLRHLDRQQPVDRVHARGEIVRQDLVGVLARDPEALLDLRQAGRVGMAKADRQRALRFAAVPFGIAQSAVDAPLRHLVVVDIEHALFPRFGQPVAGLGTELSHQASPSFLKISAGVSRTARKPLVRKITPLT